MLLKNVLAVSLVAVISSCSPIQTVPLHNLQNSPAGEAVQFFYESQGGKAEAYLTRPTGDGPFPVMVLLHGHSWRQEGAKRIVPVAEEFSTELCYASLAISLPGYGMTEIEGDRDSPEIITRVVLDGVSKVAGLPWVDKKRVVLYGLSRGAVFAATLVDKIQGLQGVVLHSGAYDIDRLYKETPTQWVRRAINPNGESNPRLFSVLPDTPKWTAATLILHGGNDQIVPSSQALLLRDRLEALRKPYRFAIFPDAGHRLPTNGVKQEVFSFLTQYVGSGCRVNGP